MATFTSLFADLIGAELPYSFSEYLLNVVQVADGNSTLEQSSIAVETEASTEEGKANDEDFSDLTCAICLNDIDLQDLAMVKGCEHAYCGKSDFYACL